LVLDDTFDDEHTHGAHVGTVVGDLLEGH